MNDFFVEKLTCTPALLPSHGVLTSHALKVTTDAFLVASLIETQARNRAEIVLREAEQQSEELINKIYQQAVEKAAQLQIVMEKARDDFYTRSEPMILAMAQGVFERLTGSLAPDEKIRAVLIRLKKEVPQKLNDVVLLLNPDDIECLDNSVVPWPLMADASLPRYSCRLEADSGEWKVSFEIALSALQEAFLNMQIGFSE